MTRQELRVFLDTWFCGCGLPEIAAARLHSLLALHPIYDHRPEVECLIPDEGTQYLLFYTLDHFGLTEHGGSVGGSWLTDKGRAVLAALERERSNGYGMLMEMSCVHGYSVEGEHCPECAKG